MMFDYDTLRLSDGYNKKKIPSSMSGCAVCVYDLYLEAKACYVQALFKTLDKFEEQGTSQVLWPDEVMRLRTKRQDGKGKSVNAFVEDVVGEEHEDESPLDATMKAFLELEKELQSTSRR